LHVDGRDKTEGAFYSRRIGAAPDAPATPYDYLHQPSATTIYGAGKLTGKDGPWSVGAFDGVTGSEDATVQLGDTKQDVDVAPLTNYAMLRVKRDFGGGTSSIGTSLSAVNRALSGGLENTLRDQAYVGGATASHRFWDNSWSFDMSMLGSYVHGSEEAIASTQELQRHLYQRPDATYLHFDPHRTSLSGFDLSMQIGQLGDTKHWRYGIGGDVRTPGLELNDIGFQQTADHLTHAFWMQYREDAPSDYLLNWQANHDVYYLANFGPELLTLGYECNASAQFLNYWLVNFNCSALDNRWNPGALRGGPQLRATNTYWSSLTVTTDTRKWMWFSLTGSYTHDPVGQVDTGEVDLGAQIQARPNLDIYVGPTWAARSDPLQYITEVNDSNNQPHYIFGAIDQRTTSLTLRVNWTFSPHLALQVYAQPFVAAGRYDDIKDVDNPHAQNFTDRFHIFTGSEIRQDDTNLYLNRGFGTQELVVARPDFDFRQIRSTAVLRWEWRPGSNVYAIWSHGQTSQDLARFDLTHDLGQLGRAPADDIVMVKLNYWIGL
jgi:hypothetical protein